MTSRAAIAVLDIGKTTVKLTAADPETGGALYQRTRPNRVEPGPPFPHFDTDAILDWVLTELAGRPPELGIAAIVPVAHGATVALADDDGLVFPVMDYEASEPDATGEDYARLRPDFSETFSPALPGGMNFARQIYWLSRQWPDRFATVRHVLAYPQFWTFALTGIATSEVTSFGSHSDLWAPGRGRLSSLAEAMGIADRVPPLRRAWDMIGPLRPDLAERAAISPRCPVLCGIHDSNASLLPHLQSRRAPFTLASTGTWAVTMAIGGRLDALDPARDCLANVDVYGQPVPSARFMGGREFSLLTEGTEGAHSDPALVDEVMAGPELIRPGLIPGVGPFPEGRGGWTVDPESLDPERRRTAAACYMARMLMVARELTGGTGPMIIEGPFAENRSIPVALDRLGLRELHLERNAGGTLAGAMELAGMAGIAAPSASGGTAA